MTHQIEGDPSCIPDLRDDGRVSEVLADVAYKRLAIVNVCFIGTRGGPWVLVDAGLPATAGMIRRAAEDRFGAGARPETIIITHGHFDHAGALESLTETWRVPVYAHSLEMRYLNGQAAYPPPDPKGGLMAWLSPLYPRDPVDVGAFLKPLPETGSVPSLPDWRWLHVPGHSPGQIALWRETDRTLISADAVITTAQESAYAVATQAPELHGPPQYFTLNWGEARESVRRLAALAPELLMSGHGQPGAGPEMRRALNTLATEFDRFAVPAGGKYVTRPLDVEHGDVYQRPSKRL